AGALEPVLLPVAPAGDDRPALAGGGTRLNTGEKKARPGRAFHNGRAARLTEPWPCRAGTAGTPTASAAASAARSAASRLPAWAVRRCARRPGGSHASRTATSPAPASTGLFPA